MPCAYCGSNATLTREHVIPRFIYEVGYRGGSRSITGWNLAARKRIAAEQTIRDVCATCNSGPLSLLDSYGKKFLEGTGLLEGDYKQNTIDLTYDYALLARWLLKLSFNSSRRTGNHTEVLSYFVPYILGATAAPPMHTALLALMMKGWTVTADMLQRHPENLSGYRIGDSFRPFYFRGGIAHIPADCGVIARSCIFGCLGLFVLIEVWDRTKGIFNRDVRQFTKYWPGSLELAPARRLVVLKEGERTWADEYAPMLHIQRAIEESQ
jgi:hypothetical protein